MADVMWVDPVKLIPSAAVGITIKAHQNRKNKWFVNLCDDDSNKKWSKSESFKKENLINYRNWSTPSKPNKKLNFLLLMITWIELCVNIFLIRCWLHGWTWTTLISHVTRFSLFRSQRIKLRNRTESKDQTRDRDQRDKELKILRLIFRKLTPSWDTGVCDSYRVA